MKQTHLLLRSQHRLTWQLQPEKLAKLLPPGCPTDLPLVRISACGPLNVEILAAVSSDGLASYEAIDVPTNGGTTALNLLKLLISQPERFAMKDWLTEKLRHTKGESEDSNEWGELGGGLVRLDT